MKLLIDADACPDMDAIIALSARNQIEVLIICDTSHLIEKEGIQTIVASKGADSVDFMLLNRVSKGDLVITQDYGLAALVLSKQGIVLHPNGWEYSTDNIEGLLMQRHMNKKARLAGERNKGPSKRTTQQSGQLLGKLLECIERK